MASYDANFRLVALLHYKLGLTTRTQYLKSLTDTELWSLSADQDIENERLRRLRNELEI